MMTTVEESAALREDEMAWKSAGSAEVQTIRTGGVPTRQCKDYAGGKIQMLDEILPQLFNSIAGNSKISTEVYAFCVWVEQSEHCFARLKLATPGFPATLQALELPEDDSIPDWVSENQRALIISTDAESRFPDFVEQLSDVGIKSFCAVPLTINNRRVGVCGLVSTKDDAFRSATLDSVWRDLAKASAKAKGDTEFMRPPELDQCINEAIYCPELQISSADNFEGIIGRSTRITDLRKSIKVVAPTDSTVLILGETGTGKELIARAIHNLSSRCNRPFIKVNCAAIPSGLVESELFGHERGSFTGAVGRRIGRFEMAHGGTLFLDEIGDIPSELQPKLLRVLQEQEFERLGGTQTIRVDVRIVAATSRDLPRMVSTGEFRGDLYYRLNVFPLRVPALRERPEDIALLVRHFMEVYARRMSKQVKDVPRQAMECLINHSWPGNVRELQNIVERAIILSPGKVLCVPADELNQRTGAGISACQSKNVETTTFEDATREHIIQALAATNWVLGGPKGAGARLGLARTTLINKMKKLGISRAQA